MIKYTTYYNGVKKLDVKPEYDVDNPYYKSAELSTVADLLKEIDEELRKAGKLDF